MRHTLSPLLFVHAWDEAPSISVSLHPHTRAIVHSPFLVFFIAKVAKHHTDPLHSLCSNAAPAIRLSRSLSHTQTASCCPPRSHIARTTRRRSNIYICTNCQPETDLQGEVYAKPHLLFFIELIQNVRKKRKPQSFLDIMTTVDCRGRIGTHLELLPLN